MNFTSQGGAQRVYLSGFRIVTEYDKSRHCEYGVVLDARLQWVRFSQVKAVFKALLPMPQASRSRASWEVVRGIRPTASGLRLETAYLARKCTAIESFLCAVLDELICEPAHLGELLKAPTLRASRTKQTQRIRRGRSGLRISIR